MPSPTMISLPEHVRRFLGERRFASVATVDADGAPRQAVIWYRLEGDEIIINSLEGRRWPTNLLRDPRISISVTDARHESWVGLNGTAEAIGDQARAQADIAAMARFYHADDPDYAEKLIKSRFETQRRVSFRVTVRGIHDHVEEA